MEFENFGTPYEEAGYLGDGVARNRLFDTGVRKANPQANRYCLICSEPLTDQRGIAEFTLDGLVGQVHKACMEMEPTRKATPPPQAPQTNASAYEPVPSASQCVLCHRPVQQGERLVQRRGIKAHASCVSAVLGILGRGASGPSTTRTPEPTRKSVATAEEKLVARAIYEALWG